MAAHDDNDELVIRVRGLANHFGEQVVHEAVGAVGEAPAELGNL